MTSYSNIGMIILAAGASRRLGHPKQLVRFNGRTLLQHILDIAGSIDFNSRVLVLGAKAKEIRVETDVKNFEVVINEAWEDGLSGSIRTGLKALLQAEKKPEHVLFLLADQPLVSRKDIVQLINLQLEQKAQATFSEYAGDVGVPAIFSREVFPQLLKLKGDQGAKKLIYNDDFEYATMRFDLGNFDVDTAKDVELLKKMEKE